MIKRALLYAAIAVAFDAVCAGIAQAGHFAYGNFAIFGILLFIGMGINAGRTLAPRRAITAIAVASIAEATLGWYVASLIGPARPSPSVALSSIVAYACFGAVVDFVSGAIGAFLGGRAVARR